MGAQSDMYLGRGYINAPQLPAVLSFQPQFADGVFGIVGRGVVLRSVYPSREAHGPHVSSLVNVPLLSDQRSAHHQPPHGCRPAEIATLHHLSEVLHGERESKPADILDAADSVSISTIGIVQYLSCVPGVTDFSHLLQVHLPVHIST